MDTQPREDQVRRSIPETAFELAITELNLPLNVISLLGDGGFTNVGDLMLRLKMERESLLSINGIGPKTLASIELAVSEFDLEKKTPTYPEPIPAFGDHYKTAPSAEVSLEPTSKDEMEAEGQAEVKPIGEKKVKKKKGKKMSAKKGKKNGQKKAKKGKQKGKKKKKK